YPQLRKAIDNPETYNIEIVRNEMFKHLDYYVTESSGHNSEYNPWFRKRPELIEKYCTHGTGWNPGVYAYIRDAYLKREETWRDDITREISEETSLDRSNEYASYIFNAIFGDGTILKFNGNVRNYGLIDNLPPGCCVEVPVYASKAGLEPLHVGPLPDHLATMVNVSARIEEMVVEAYQEGDKRKIFHAICMDPLTSAVLSLQETKDMVDEMFEYNKDYLPYFK
ncbi:MAG: alpha-glucosidase/alpha-galactosidase, partial [Defluviitaleaceae bacterium]|nr:alpha-glucosidase/alpha-galactosidase [Defluviitaleaceae bacterium]